MRTRPGFLITLLRALGIIILVLLLLVAAVFGVLTVLEYRPADEESLDITGSSLKQLKAGDTITLESWNVGYLGLGAGADFFMDGGKSVMSQSRDQVEDNLAAVSDEITGSGADFVLLQEVDRDSVRSYHIDQVDAFSAARGENASVFACNFDVAFVPYPIPPIGKVYGGILTLSDYEISSARRYQLPIPFSWPIRIGMLKRCLLVTRIPISDSDKELVLVNLHLEAYDDGEGKVAQTQMLADLLNRESTSGNYVIAGGDFNQTFSNTDISAYPTYEGTWQAGFIETDSFTDYVSLQDASVPTCRSLDRPYDPGDEQFQYYVIDGYIVSKNLLEPTVTTKDLGFENSDHNPVMLQVTIPAE